MSEFKFVPPLKLKGGNAVHTLDDAVRFLIAYKDTRQSTRQRRLLYHLEGAIGEAEERDAAYEFREWAQAEHLVGE